MGKGDKRTKRGKIIAGSYGKSRPKPKNSFTPPPEPKEEKKPAKRGRKKKTEE